MRQFEHAITKTSLNEQICGFGFGSNLENSQFGEENSRFIKFIASFDNIQYADVARADSWFLPGFQCRR
jgi:hypothetical protein